VTEKNGEPIMAKKRERSKAGAPDHIDPAKPAGNAQFDPREQNVREDMPVKQQRSAGEPSRGSGPVRRDDPRLPGRPEEGEPVQ
jgi:hypothetical protein